eukprot:1605357-Prymnesium_polylepis.1
MEVGVGERLLFLRFLARECQTPVATEQVAAASSLLANRKPNKSMWSDAEELHLLLDNWATDAGCVKLPPSVRTVVEEKT